MRIRFLLFLSICIFLCGCGDNRKSENSDSALETTAEGITEYIEWVDNSRINLDVNDYYNLEINLQYVLALSKDAYEKSFEGEYVLKVTSKGTELLFDGKNVDDNDVLWVELSSAFPEWKEIVKRTNIPDAVLTIKDGKVIRTLNPSDYVKID